MTSMTIGQLVTLLFGAGRATYPELNKQWITASFRIGGLLPKSLMMVTIQRLGEVDLVCRALENELQKNPAPEGEMDFRPNYLHVLSEWWVGSAYAVCFAIKDRNLRTDDLFLNLANDLRMIRVQTEKYEIPSDQNLKQPLPLFHAVDADENKPAIVYDKNDPLRAHIARSAVSNRSSLMWEVLDIVQMNTRWLERLELSERFLRLVHDEAVNS